MVAPFAEAPRVRLVVAVEVASETMGPCLFERACQVILAAASAAGVQAAILGRLALALRCPTAEAAPLITRTVVRLLSQTAMAPPSAAAIVVVTVGVGVRDLTGLRRVSAPVEGEATTPCSPDSLPPTPPEVEAASPSGPCTPRVPDVATSTCLPRLRRAPPTPTLGSPA